MVQHLVDSRHLLMEDNQFEVDSQPEVDNQFEVLAVDTLDLMQDIVAHSWDSLVVVFVDRVAVDKVVDLRKQILFCSENNMVLVISFNFYRV